MKGFIERLFRPCPHQWYTFQAESKQEGYTAIATVSICGYSDCQKTKVHSFGKLPDYANPQLISLSQSEQE